MSWFMKYIVSILEKKYKSMMYIYKPSYDNIQIIVTLCITFKKIWELFEDMSTEKWRPLFSVFNVNPMDLKCCCKGKTCLLWID